MKSLASLLIAATAALPTLAITGAWTDKVGVADGFLYCRQYKPSGKSFGCYGDDLGDFPVQKHYKSLILAYPIPNINAPLDAAILLEHTPILPRDPYHYVVHTTEQLFIDVSPGAFSPVRVTPSGVGNASLTGGETTTGFHRSYVLSWYDAAAGKLGDGWAWVPVEGYAGLYQLWWDQALFERTATPARYDAVNAPIVAPVPLGATTVERGFPPATARRSRRRRDIGSGEQPEQQQQQMQMLDARQDVEGEAPYPRVGVFGGIESPASLEWV